VTVQAIHYLIRPDELQRLPKEEVVVIGLGILASSAKPFEIPKKGIRYF
jgi:hypothetical protein